MGLALWLLLGIGIFCLGFWLTRQLQRPASSALSGTMPQSNPATRNNRAVPPLSQMALEQQVRDLMMQGRRIDAIKLVRQHKNWNLKKARDYVHEVSRSGLSGGWSSAPVAGTQAELPLEVQQEVDALLANNQKIAAIKRVRDVTGWDLLTAKTYVERL